MRERERTEERLVTEPWRRFYLDPRWPKVREMTLRRDQYRCQALINGVQCTKTHGLEAHHIIALKDGGPPFDLANTIALCGSCHQKITDNVRT